MSLPCLGRAGWGQSTPIKGVYYRSDRGLISGGWGFRPGQARLHTIGRTKANWMRERRIRLLRRFDGQKFMGLKAEEVATVAEALARLSGAIYRGVFISYVSVGSAGQDWVQKVHATLLGQAVGQGILPYSMYTTASKDAAQFLLDSFSLVSAS